jgi:hypothetical protein
MGGIDFPNGILTDWRMRCRPLPGRILLLSASHSGDRQLGGGLDNSTLQLTSKISAPAAPHVS